MKTIVAITTELAIKIGNGFLYTSGGLLAAVAFRYFFHCGING